MSKVKTISFVLLLSCLFGGHTAFSETSSFTRDKAITLSHQIVDALLKDRYEYIYNRSDKNLRDVAPYDKFKEILQNMYVSLGGKPLEAEFKWDEAGYKLWPSGEKVPLRKFWYAVRTARYEKGAYFLFVEIVPDGEDCALAGLMIARFDKEVPPQLRSAPDREASY